MSRTTTSAAATPASSRRLLTPLATILQDTTVVASLSNVSGMLLCHGFMLLCSLRRAQQ